MVSSPAQPLSIRPASSKQGYGQKGAICGLLG
jgi:hypothetical protein